MQAAGRVTGIVVACALATLTPNDARAGSCQELIPKESKLVFSHEERIEGGKRCYVRHTDGGEPTYHGVVWDEPTASTDEKHGCDVNEPFLLQLWERNLDARHAAAQATTTKKDLAARTFAAAAVFDDTCRNTTVVQGAFTGSTGPHAERQVMTKLVGDKALKPGYSLVWMIDQEPCRSPDKQPKDGYCTTALKDFAHAQKVASRVFVVVKVKGTAKKVPEVGSAKTFATTAYQHRDDKPADKKKYWPTKANYMELEEFRVKP